MAINKLVLEKDGLVVGNTQLVASGSGISVGGLSVTGDASFTGNATFSSLGDTAFSSNSTFKLPAGNTALRSTSPSLNTLRYNTDYNTIEHYNGSRWISGDFPGSAPINAANSATEIFNAGMRGKGFFWLNSPNGGVVLNFCDLDTLDENNVSGWILVAAFPSSPLWPQNGITTRKTIDPNSVLLNDTDGAANATRNMWSANWGDYNLNSFRITSSVTAYDTGSNAAADWYYYYQNACKWKEVWAWSSGGVNYINDTSGSNSGNINAPFHVGWPNPVNSATSLPRCCLRGFNWAYNIKFKYQVAQRWNGLSDTAATGTSQQTINYWNGLTNPGVTLNWNFNGDGSLAILPQGSADNTAGQDCNNQNAKFGFDDTISTALWSANSTNNVGQTGTTDSARSLFFWVK